MTVSFRRPSLRLYLLISLLTFSFCMPCVAATVKRSAAPNRLAVIDSIVQDAIRDGQTPGAVVLIGHNDKVIYRKAFGSRALEPRREAMTLDTIFDLASLTKVVATTTAVMQLSEQGKVRMNDANKRWVAEMAPFRGAKIVTYHPSWPNFARHFGLDIAGTVEPKPGIPPSPSHTLEIINLIKQQHIKVIVMEPYFDRKTPDFIGERTGAKVVVLYPSVAGKAGLDDYFKLFDYDLNELTKALK